MSQYYTKGQIDSQATVVGARIKSRTTGAFIKTQIDNLPDANIITDAERAKIATIESAKYKGLFTSSGAIPLTDNVSGMYADVDTGSAGSDVQRYIWDANDNKWVQQGAAVGAETAASIKSKYESNPNTNAYTDAEKAKLAGITDAADISTFTANLDAALA